ncbi:FeoA domain protein [compost metagenome]|jgi:Fe2+ transport system protein FeoA
MTLDQVNRGQRVIIRGIDSPEVKTQIIRFGLGEGESAVCQEKLPQGPIVLRKNRQEIAIGRNLARSIHVEIVTP